MNNNLKNALRGALSFGVIAPPIGSVVFSMNMMRETIIGITPFELTTFITMPFFIALISYFLGFVPAAISGFLIGFFSGNFYSRPRRLFAASICMLIAILYGVLCNFQRLSDFEIFAEIVLMMGGAGFVAGYFVTGMFEKSYRFQKIETSRHKLRIAIPKAIKIKRYQYKLLKC
jgi:hypothetical protein